MYYTGISTRQSHSNSSSTWCVSHSDSRLIHPAIFPNSLGNAYSLTDSILTGQRHSHHFGTVLNSSRTPIRHALTCSIVVFTRYRRKSSGHHYGSTTYQRHYSDACQSHPFIVRFLTGGEYCSGLGFWSLDPVVLTPPTSLSPLSHHVAPSLSLLSTLIDTLDHLLIIINLSRMCIYLSPTSWSTKLLCVKPSKLSNRTRTHSWPTKHLLIHNAKSVCVSYFYVRVILISHFSNIHVILLFLGTPTTIRCIASRELFPNTCWQLLERNPNHVRLI